MRPETPPALDACKVEVRIAALRAAMDCVGDAGPRCVDINTFEDVPSHLLHLVASWRKAGQMPLPAGRSTRVPADGLKQIAPLAGL